MKNTRNVILGLLLTLSIASFSFKLLLGESPFSSNEIIEPAELAKVLEDHAAQKPFIFNMGSMQMIKNAESGGMGYSEESMKELKDKAAKMDKNSSIVLYCGCCKMENCPNVKPPFEYLKSNGFKNVKVLNITTDLQADWIGKGYPMKK